MVCRRDRAAEQQRARAIGQAQQLGEYRRSFRYARRIHRRDWGLSMMLFGLVPGVAIAAAGQQAGAAEPIMLGVFGGIAVLGGVLLTTAPREKVHWVHQYAGGLAQVTDGDRTVTVLHWGRLDHVLREYQAGSSDGPGLTQIRVATTDGGEFTIGSGHTGIYQIGAEISDVLVAKRLPAALTLAGTGAPVHFGGLSISQVGIAWDTGTRWAGWQDIRWIRLTPYEVEIATAAGRGRQRIWLNDVPDAAVALLLIQRLAASRGVRQKGTPLQPPALPDRA